MKKCIIFILKIPFLLIKYILCFIKWILKMLFGWIFGWIPDFDERMSGEEFEEYVKEILKRNGFKSLELTKRSGDYGVDILGKYQGESYAIQCKKYAKPVGVAAVQQAYSGCQYYECDCAVVVTNHRFTAQAIALAHTNQVELWDGQEKAFYILEDLQFHDLVSSEDHLGMRDLYFLSQEEAMNILKNR